MLMHHYLEYWAQDDPDRVVYDDGEQTITYGEANTAADAFARALVAAGLGPGDRISAIATNRGEWLTIYYGSFKAGVVAVPLNARQHPQEWLFQLNDARASWCIAEGSFTAGIDEIRSDLIHTSTFLTMDETGPGWASLAGVMAQAASVELPRLHDPEAELYQMYTSGTTGRPKGAVLTHRAVDANITQSRLRQPMRDGERFLTPMPLFHAGAAVRLFNVVASGATIRLMPKFDEAEAVRILDEENVTVAGVVPAMVARMLAVPGVADRAYASLRTIGYGASPISVATLSRAMDVFGCGFYQAYGQTETTSSVTGLSEQDHRSAREGRPELLLSCGRPHAGTEIEIVDEDDKPVATGTTGEIRARGPQMMKGYWNRPEANAATLRDGWLYTGDAGYLDADGYLYIADRKKDMVISGGENVYPKEIENTLFDIPGVAEAAVIGVPDPQWGEVLKAFLVLAEGVTPGAVTEETAIAHCRGNLAGYKVPKSVEFRTELPRTATGKVQKHVLREPYWQGSERGVN
jgi:acyl-CoA synthetase (AMP-forming)/AMP-acid ligase II